MSRVLWAGKRGEPGRGSWDIYLLNLESNVSRRIIDQTSTVSCLGVLTLEIPLAYTHKVFTGGISLTNSDLADSSKFTPSYRLGIKERLDYALVGSGYSILIKNTEPGVKEMKTIFIPEQSATPGEATGHFTSVGVIPPAGTEGPGQGLDQILIAAHETYGGLQIPLRDFFPLEPDITGSLEISPTSSYRVPSEKVVPPLAPKKDQSIERRIRELFPQHREINYVLL